MEPDEQTEAEIRAQAGETSVGEFVLAWLDALFIHRSWFHALAACSPDYRRALATSWAGEDPNRAAAIVAISTGDTQHPLWSSFSVEMLTEFDREFGELAKNIAIGSRPRPLGPDEEEVRLVDYRRVPGHEHLLFDDQAGKASITIVPPFAAVTVRSASAGLEIHGLAFNPEYPRL